LLVKFHEVSCFAVTIRDMQSTVSKCGCAVRITQTVLYENSCLR